MTKSFGQIARETTSALRDAMLDHGFIRETVREFVIENQDAPYDDLRAAALDTAMFIGGALDLNVNHVRAILIATARPLF